MDFECFVTSVLWLLSCHALNPKYTLCKVPVSIQGSSVSRISPALRRTTRTTGVNHRISLGSLVTQMVKESACNAGALGSISGPLAMVIPEPGTRPLSAASMHQSLLKLCKLANPQPAYPALLLPLSEITIKAPAHVCPSLPLPPDCPGSSRMPPDLGSCEGNKLTLQWHKSEW